MINKNPHQHNFTDFSLHRITEVQPKYNGTAGDKAIVLRVCSCQKSEAFEYGGYKEMKILYEELTKKAPNKDA